MDESKSESASYFALIPFAVAYAYRECGKEITFMFLLTAVCAFIIYSLVFYLFRSAYEYANDKKPGKLRLLGQISLAALVSYLFLLRAFR